MGIGRVLNGLLAPVGFRLERLQSDEPRQGFYKLVDSCQIPELDTLYSLFLGERSDGFFVEVGAYDGISFSNTSCLAERGWSGLLVEPIPEFAQACRDRYASNARIAVIETAVGSSDSDIHINIAGSLTTTNATLLTAYKDIAWSRSSVEGTTAITVKQTTLDALLNRHADGRSIDVMVVDVEGAEESVFAGFSLQKWKPRILIVELAHTHPDLHALSARDASIQREIVRGGYEVIYKDQINTVFTAASQS